MRKMKDSGISFIGLIPEEWELKRAKYAASSISKGNGITKDDIVVDGDIPCVRYGEIYSKYNYAFNECVTRTKLEKVSSPQYFSHGDILFAGTGELVEEIWKSIVYMGHERCIAGGDIIILKHSQDPLYFGYALASIYAQIQKSAGKSKLKVVHISASDIGNIRILIPPYDEQVAIGKFINSKCIEINAVIADIQEQISTLEQYKRSVIAESVTRGLNTGVEMQESGAGWFTRIPVHWGFTKIDALYSLRSTKVSDYDYPPLSVTMNGIVPQLETAAKTNAHDDRKLVRKGDFAINSRSDRRGSCGISDYDGSVSLINTVLTPKGDMSPRYYNWLFHTTEFADEFYKWGHGIVDDLWTTNWQDMRNIILPVPPLNEQKEIAVFLDKKCASIDKIIAGKQEQLVTIEEYKKSLIFEYVTGKKEVPLA